MRVASDKRLIFALIAGLFSLAGLTLVSIWNSSRLLEHTRSEIHSRELLSTTAELSSALIDSHIATRNFLLNGSEDSLARYQPSLDEAKSLLSQLNDFTRDHRNQQSLVRELDSQFPAFNAILENYIQVRRTAGADAAMELLRGGESQRALGILRDALNQIRTAESALLAERQASTNRFAQTALWIHAIGGLVALVLLTSVFLRMLRENTQRRITEQQLRQSQAQLERRVAERTEALAHSLARTERMIESSPDLICVVRDERIRFINSTGLTMLGVASAEKVIGRSIFDFLEPERHDVERERIQRVLSDPHTPTQFLQQKLIRVDGTSLDIESAVTAFEDEEGPALQFAMHDITERRIAEEETRRALEEVSNIKAALDAHSILAVTDSRGRITHVNDKFCEISKYSREELIGQDHRIINSGYHSKSFFRDLWTTILEGKIWHGEIRNRAKDGKCYWVDTTIFPLPGPDGRPMQFIAIRTDITARKEDELRLGQLAEELATKNKELETAVYIVSHDLRGPLLNVQGFGRLLAKHCETVRSGITNASPEASAALDTTIPQALRFIEAGIAKMDTLLSGFLRYSRVGRAALQIQKVRIAPIVHAAAQALQFQIDEVGATIEVEELPDCLGDPTFVGQVFSNLLDNAIKYRSPKRPCHVRVTGREQGSEVIYAVQDNGIGIAPEHQLKIFDMFHRLDPKATPGEGMGLTLAQRILERLRGRLWVESQPDVGTTFYVALPGLRKLSQPE